MFEKNWTRLIGRYIATLTDPRETNKDSENYKVGLKWFDDTENYLKDRGLVIILVNSFVWTPAHYGNFIIMGLNNRTDFSHTFFPTHGENDPPSRIWRVSRKQDQITDTNAIQQSITRILDEQTNTLVHELGHSFDLADEYERWASQPIQDEISIRSNYAVIKEIETETAGTPIPIDPLELKWAKLHLIEKSDAIVNASWDVTNMDTLELTLTLGPKRARRWIKEKTSTIPVFLREFRLTTRNFTPTYAGVEFKAYINGYLPQSNENELVMLENLSISHVDAINNQILIILSKNSDLPESFGNLSKNELLNKLPGLLRPGSLLYRPMKDSVGSPIYLIDHEVMSYMKTYSSPLRRTHPCPTSTRFGIDHPEPYGTNNSLSNYVSIGTGRKLPRHDFKVLGAYEGGYCYTCGTFRSAGSCKMRNANDVEEIISMEATEFCYLCKYLIVNAINSGKLALLSTPKQYPALK